MTFQLTGDLKIVFYTGCGDESSWTADEEDDTKTHNLFFPKVQGKYRGYSTINLLDGEWDVLKIKE
jgi:hypothetical protein